MTVWTARLPLAHASALVRIARSAHPDAGETRMVVFDLDLLADRIRRLVEQFPEGALHTFAIKANPIVELLRWMVERGMGLEAASMEEVYIARRAGCDALRIVFDSPVKTHAEIEECLALGVTINVDNLDELERTIASPSFGRSRIGIRVNPGVGVGSIAATSVAGAHSRFGISTSAFMEHVVPLIERHDSLVGIHVHVGSQGISLDQLVKAQHVVATLIDYVRSVRPGWPEFVDIGGGLPTRYTDAAPGVDIADYAAALRSKVPGLFADDVQIVTEFGRALVANTACAVSRIEYVKHGDRRLVVNHLGADFLLRTAYRGDQWAHEFGALSADGTLMTGESNICDIMGPLCFAGDVIGRDVQLPDVRPGDFLLIRDVGAYTTSMWSRHCSRGIPATIGVTRSTSEAVVLLDGEGPDDVARFWDVRPD